MFLQIHHCTIDVILKDREYRRVNGQLTLVCILCISALYLTLYAFYSYLKITESDKLMIRVN